MTILLVLFFAVLVVYILPQFNTFSFKLQVPEPERPKSSVVRLFSGPNDGEIHRIAGDKEQLPPFFVAPYVPKDENGMPKEENIIGQMNGMAYIKPSLAYYQQVTDEDYIYVRDINEFELEKIKLGELPEFRREDEE